MAKKDPVLKTKRLKIEPISNDELRRLASSAEDPELKSAYGEMLAGGGQSIDGLGIYE